MTSPESPPSAAQLLHALIVIEARGVAAEFRDSARSRGRDHEVVVEKFREKYGTENVKKYYAKFDVAAAVEVG